MLTFSIGIALLAIIMLLISGIVAAAAALYFIIKWGIIALIIYGIYRLIVSLF